MLTFAPNDGYHGDKALIVLFNQDETTGAVLIVHPIVEARRHKPNRTLTPVLKILRLYQHLWRWRHRHLISLFVQQLCYQSRLQSKPRIRR